MTSREAILKALRRAALPEEPLPELPIFRGATTDLRADFKSALERASGRVLAVPPGLSSTDALGNLPLVKQSSAVCSLVPGFTGNFPHVARAHAYDSVEVLVLAAEFGVAENGAVWITDRVTKQRSVFFLAEHVVALLDATQIIPDMHAAYARVELQEQAFGCFVCGPSKTADIEQELVIGAHGPRTLTVLLH